MKKCTLAANDLTDVHLVILRAVKACNDGCFDSQSRLTATGPVALLSRILPNELRAARTEYVKAASELKASGWIQDNSLGRTSGLVHYWPSEEAKALLESQLTPA